ncbi:MAG: hypothetical protein SFV19_06650 [Rhodospirillaceae bacterium]|nr:hypothetical protein [Rhodospirillaceae bacterium]
MNNPAVTLRQLLLMLCTSSSLLSGCNSIPEAHDDFDAAKEKFTQYKEYLKVGETELAIAALEQAADEGLSAAQAELGEVYAQGLYVDRNLDLAKHWFLKSVRNNERERLHEISCFLLDYGDASEQREAARYLTDLAEANKLDSQVVMIKLFDLGIGVKADSIQRERWRNRAITTVRRHLDPVAVAHRDATRRRNVDIVDQLLASPGCASVLDRRSARTRYVIRQMGVPDRP